jgi:hypothetical protein
MLNVRRSPFGVWQNIQRLLRAPLFLSDSHQTEPIFAAERCVKR